MNHQIKPLAFYLPQYHPIPENDKWWGKGFTEWTNVTKAKPLFEGHEQPLLAGELGYYDLRVPEIREQQAKMAQEHGIYGFIYYHYWFGSGKQLLERIALDMLNSGKPDFPFCFCWANETWSGIWHGLENNILAEQTYPEHDAKNHFNYLLSFFRDSRYIKINNKPLLIIYDAVHLDHNAPKYAEELQTLAKKNGFDGIYLVASNKTYDSLDYLSMGYDGKISDAFRSAWAKYINKKPYISAANYYKNRVLGAVGVKKKEEPPVKMQDMALVVEDLAFTESGITTFPMVLPNWDNTPRSGNRGLILTNNSPKLFEKQTEKAVKYLENTEYEEKFLIIKSWNEWAEGNILEPDGKNGRAYLEAFYQALHKK